jgi:succinate dehydrogenase flavoprotein subunit
MVRFAQPRISNMMQAEALPRGAEAKADREDCPDRDDSDWMQPTLSRLDPATGSVPIDYRPVHTYAFTNDASYIEPQKRVY